MSNHPIIKSLLASELLVLLGVDNSGLSSATLASLTVSQTDHIVQTLEAALGAFQHHVHGHIARCNHHRNTMSSKIDQLPVELLSRILLLSVPLED